MIDKFVLFTVCILKQLKLVLNTKHCLLADDPGSYCFGSIREGVFDGQIVTNGGTYYVERSHKHLKKDLIQKIREKEGKSDAHSVIYHEKNIQYPVNHHRNSKLDKEHN